MAAIRYLTYCSLGILLNLAILVIAGVDGDTTWLELAVTSIIFVIAAFYIRGTDFPERRRDVFRKLTDPFYE